MNDVEATSEAYVVASTAASRISLPLRFFKKYARIILLSDGKSVTTAQTVRNALPHVPIEVQSNYRIPYPSSDDCLVFALPAARDLDSEAILSTLIQCHKNQTNIVAITCGGRLKEYCEKLGTLHINIPETTSDKTLQDYSLIIPIVCLQMLGTVPDMSPDRMREAIEAVKDARASFGKEASREIVKTILNAQTKRYGLRIVVPQGLEGPALELADTLSSLLSTPASVHPASPTELSTLARSLNPKRRDSFLLITGGIPGILGDHSRELVDFFEKTLRSHPIKHKGAVIRLDLATSDKDSALKNVLTARAVLESIATGAIEKSLSGTGTLGKNIGSPSMSKRVLERYNKRSRLLQLLDEQVEILSNHRDGELAAARRAAEVFDAAKSGGGIGSGSEAAADAAADATARDGGGGGVADKNGSEGSDGTVNEDSVVADTPDSGGEAATGGKPQE